MSQPETSSSPWTDPQASLRILVGPYHLAQHWEYMRGAWDSHDTLTFGTHEHADVRARGIDSIDSILARTPPGWAPDLIVLWRPEYGSLPPGIQRVDVPVVMLTSDWYLGFSDCVESARFVNLVITGTRGERVFRAAGFDHVLAMPMLGFQPGIDAPRPGGVRDIDVFSATNVNWFIHGFRQRVLSRLLDLPDRVDVRLRSDLSRREYNRHLARTRVFVNNAVVGELNMKVYEVCAAGACLFLERDNIDVHDILVPGESVVLYDLDDLQEKVLYYLEHEDERAAIAARGHAAVRCRSYRSQMDDIVRRLREIGRHRLLAGGREIVRASQPLQDRHHLAYSALHAHGNVEALADATDRLATSEASVDQTLVGTIQLLLQEEVPGFAERRGWSAEGILERLRRASTLPDARMSSLYAVAVASHRLGSPADALRASEKCLVALEAGEPIPFAAGHLYLLWKHQRYELERAAWEAVETGLNPQEAIRPILVEGLLLVQCELHTREGDVEAAIRALRRAVATRPGGSMARIGLGHLYARAARWTEARDVWREHLAQHPMSHDGYPALFEAEIRLGAWRDAEHTLQRFRRLCRVWSWPRQAVRGMQALLEAAPTGNPVDRAPRTEAHAHDGSAFQVGAAGASFEPETESTIQENDASVAVPAGAMTSR